MKRDLVVNSIRSSDDGGAAAPREAARYPLRSHRCRAERKKPAKLMAEDAQRMTPLDALRTGGPGVIVSARTESDRSRVATVVAGTWSS